MWKLLVVIVFFLALKYSGAVKCKICSEYIKAGDTSSDLKSCKNGINTKSCEGERCFSASGTAKGLNFYDKIFQFNYNIFFDFSPFG